MAAVTRKDARPRMLAWQGLKATGRPRHAGDCIRGLQAYSPARL